MSRGKRIQNRHVHVNKYARFSKADGALARNLAEQEREQKNKDEEKKEKERRAGWYSGFGGRGSLSERFGRLFYISPQSEDRNTAYFTY